jgi:DnaK suppressor protein
MPVSKKKDPSAPATDIHGIKPYVQKKGEEYMSKEMHDHFRAILNAWRQELLDEVSRTVHTMQDETANHPDPNDRASQETDMALELRSRDRERKLIKKIEEAIQTLESGEYGYCEQCGVEIGVQRLEARPTATLCVDCKTLDEIREKQMG